MIVQLGPHLNSDKTFSLGHETVAVSAEDEN